MAKPKLTLSEIKVNSFVTTLDNERMQHIKGGYFLIRGRRFTYRTRWTSVDTRSDESEFVSRLGARKQ